MTMAEEDSRAPRWRERLTGVDHLGTLAGLILLAAGFGLLALAWGRVAGLTAVGRQMPYLVSAGCGGLALIGSGLTLISVATKWEDARARRSQQADLRSLVDELRRLLDPGDSR